MTLNKKIKEKEKDLNIIRIFMRLKGLIQKIMLIANVEIKKYCHKPFAKYFNPFITEESPVIIHCCYHKVGTVWFGRILRDVAAEFGLSFEIGSTYKSIRNFELNQDVDIFLDFGSHVDLESLDEYVGSHMIRDPRDMIVSGYFYHRRTNELWANIPRPEYRGMSYKEYLNSIGQSEGLLAEIKHANFWVKHMQEWNFNNKRIFEIRYEDILDNEAMIFRNMFRHYRFSKEAINKSCQIYEKYSFNRRQREFLLDVNQ